MNANGNHSLKLRSLRFAKAGGSKLGGLICAFLLAASNGDADSGFQLSSDFDGPILESNNFGGGIDFIIEMHNFSGFDGFVPDGDPRGWVNSQTIVSNVFEIETVSVRMDISTAWNDDIYAYLTHGSGFTVLLNRVGRTDSNLDGYGDGGFNATFSDGASHGDVHNYQGVVSLSPGSQLTGTWQPDARDVDPSLVTDQSPRSAFLSSFENLNANGEWTLFIADMSGGGSTVVNGWGLTVVGVIPEPTTYTLIFGLLIVGLLFFRTKRVRFFSGVRK